LIPDEVTYVGSCKLFDMAVTRGGGIARQG
jgi:hypothetical protein